MLSYQALVWARGGWEGAELEAMGNFLLCTEVAPMLLKCSCQRSLTMV
jgi:hypothetical protein